MNVLGDGATFTVMYIHNNYPTLTGGGTINIGSDTEAGRMVVTSTGSVEPDGWDSIVKFTGTVNVGAKGDISISGGFPLGVAQHFLIRNAQCKGNGIRNVAEFQ